MEYFGEHLWVGKLGELLVTLGFVSAIVAALSSLFNLQKQNNQLLLQSKISFFDAWLQCLCHNWVDILYDD